MSNQNNQKTPANQSQNDQTVSVDKSRCIGCGMCVSLNPNIFEIQDDGKAGVIAGQECKIGQSEEAIEMCPVGAIFVS